MKIDGRTIDVSSPDKVFFPDAGITKGDLVDYYRRVAEVMLPHVEGRAVTLQRFPDGIGEDGFYQKETPEYFPEWIRRVEVEKEGGTVNHLVVEEAATLAYLADQGCITPHVWTSRVDRLRVPDRMVFDFDPPGDDPEEAFEEVRWAARSTREVLRQLGLAAFVQTSGSRGLHIHVPLAGDLGFDAVRELARGVAEVLVRRHPERLTTAQRKAKRGERIFIDVLRNAYAQTAVAPYAVRARPGAPVATPLEWDELGRSGMSPVAYTVENLFRRLGQRSDPWDRMGDAAADPGEARTRLDALPEASGDG